MLKNNFIKISKGLTQTFMKKNVYFNNHDNGVIEICTSRGDTCSQTHLCEAISALIGENLDLEVASNSIMMSSLGLDGTIIIFKKPKS